MNSSKWSAGLALGLIAGSMILASATIFLGWSIFAQSVVLGVGLILGALVHRPRRSNILLAIFYAACLLLVALVGMWGRWKVFPVWLFSTLIWMYWLQIHDERRLTCQH